MDFFSSIFEFFSAIWNVLLNVFNSMGTLFTILMNVITVPNLLVGVLPAFIYTSMLIVIGVGVVKVILGWGNN